MPLHFKSQQSYKKWLAFVHMNLPPSAHPQRVMIAGKPHHVQHDIDTMKREDILKKKSHELGMKSREMHVSRLSQN